MAKLTSLFLLLALLGCSSSGQWEFQWQQQSDSSGCAVGESSMDCQVIRYRNAN